MAESIDFLSRESSIDERDTDNMRHRMKREIITLCGSTRFRDEFQEVERALTLEGKIPLPPAIYGKAEGIAYPEELALHLWKVHMDKIAISDGIFVVNPQGYLGERTHKEIAIAQEQGKFVRYYSEEYHVIKEKNKQIRDLQHKA
jgi:hypothetical protein